LNYNSQMWRQDTAGTWLLGEDIGYGLGWKLQAGSLTQYSTGIWGQVDHYVFTDSTGAEYKLYQNGSTGLWTSTESIYATYDSNANILHFNDGSFWIMGCISGGEEPDLGTLYPTQMEDSNGNYLTISYNQGAGTGWPNSSSRINQIVDIRAPYGSPTYQFNYNPNTNELTGINSSLNGQQTTLYTFNTAIQNLTSPTPSGANYGNTNVLTSVMGAPGYTTQFTYDTGSELTQVTFPTGGHFRYSYKTWNYTGAVTGQSRYIREVGTRYLSMNSDGSNEYAYPIGRSSDPNDGSLGLHYWCTLADPSGIGFKVWFFNASSGTPVWELGLTNNYQDRVSTSNSFAPRQYYYTWAQDPGSNAYIATRQTLWDGGQGYQQNSYETQTLDGNGNMLTRNIYDYTNSATPIRKYTYTYVTDGNYTSRYIRNKLATAIVTDGFGNNAVTLVHNQYDGDGGFPYGFGNGAGVSPPTNYGSLTMHDSNYSSSFPYRGNLTLQTTPSGVTGTVFDFVGNPWLTQGPHQPAAGVSTALSSNYTQPSAITANNTSASTVSLSYDALFLPTNFTGPNGATASATNDAFGRVTRSTSTDGAVTNYTYSSGSLPVTQLAVTGIQGQSGLTNATWTQTTLDGLGRAIKVQSGPGQTPGSAVTETDTTYGPCACSPTGKMTGASQPYQPGSASYWTNYTYDAIGRTVRVVSPDGASATTYVYQGNTTTVTDPAGKWKTTVTDAQGNNTQVTEPDPTGSTSGYQTYYTYDVMEHLTQVSMPRGSITQTRTFNYSPTTHLLTNETHPETGTTTYTYTPDSFTYDLLTSKTDAKGQVTKYTYDSYYRVTAINRYTSQANFNSGTDDPCQRVNNVYDAYSSSTFNSAYSWGHLAASTTGDPSCVINSAGATQQFSELYSYSYTGAGHVAQKRLQLYQATAGNVSGGTATWWDVGYTYNVFGQAVSVTYPNSGGSGAQTYTTGFDSMQRPANLTDSRGLSGAGGDL
jgi:YD repeat-containing protein